VNFDIKQGYQQTPQLNNIEMKQANIQLLSAQSPINNLNLYFKRHPLSRFPNHLITEIES
jgi:hypothetical protein